MEHRKYFLLVLFIVSRNKSHWHCRSETNGWTHIFNTNINCFGFSDLFSWNVASSDFRYRAKLSPEMGVLSDSSNISVVIVHATYWNLARAGWFSHHSVKKEEFWLRG